MTTIGTGPSRPTRPFPLSWPQWPLLVDIGVVLFLMAVGPRSIIEQPHHPARALLFAGLVIPLLFRRRAPLAAFAVMATVAFGQWLAAEPVVADAALLVGLYSVAVASRRWQLIAAAATLEVGALLAVLRFTAPHGGRILAFVFLSGLITAAGVLGVTVRVRRAYLQEVEERAARLEFERDQQAQLAVAGERARVAREMHDIVAHNLAVLIALTDGAALTLRSDPERATTALTEAGRTGRAALTDLRRVLGVLREPTGPAALAPAPGLADLEPLLASVRQTGLTVRYEASGPVAELPPALQLNAFRIIQEALTNTIKHADRPSAVDVSLRVSDSAVEVLVRDDGRGGAAPAPDAATDAAGGHGIAGMRERAAVHSGDVRAGRTRTGWLVRAWLPVRPAAEPALAGAIA